MLSVGGGYCGTLWADAVAATAAAAAAAVSSPQPSSPSDAARWTVRDEVSGSSEDISIYFNFFFFLLSRLVRVIIPFYAPRFVLLHP